MAADDPFPELLQVVLDTTDTRRLADFYRDLLGLHYAPGHDQPDPAGDEWLVLIDAEGLRRLAFQRVPTLPEVTWPDGPVAQQLHLDLAVPTVEQLDVHHERILTLGGRLIQDRAGDVDEPLRVYADPAGHPFCVFVRQPPA